MPHKAKRAGLRCRGGPFELLGSGNLQQIERMGTPRIAELRINGAMCIPNVLKFIR
jgi:hypothetical protein